MSYAQILGRPFFDRRNPRPSERLPASLICCVSVEVMRARVRAARVPFWVSFVPVMKYKPTYHARARARRAPRLSRTRPEPRPSRDRRLRP